MLLGYIPRRNAKIRPHRIAVVDKDVRLTFFEQNARINRLANALHSLGIRKGDRVAVLNHNCYQYIEAYFAAAKIGAPLVPLNFRMPANELQYILDDSGAKLLIVGDTYLSVANELRATSHNIEHFVCFDATRSGYYSYESLLDAASVAEPQATVQEDDIFVLGYTGGTTGRPKGVMITHKNVISSCFNVVMPLSLNPEASLLNVAPIFHAGGAMVMLCFAFVGGANYMGTSSAPVEILKCIDAEKITHTLIVPSVMTTLLQELTRSQFNLSSLKCIFYGTAPIPFETLNAAMKMFGCSFCQVYGATETFVPMTMLLPEDHVQDGSPLQKERLTSAGTEVFGVEIKVVDGDDNELPIGQAGEIVARGDNIMKGYWNLESLTEKTLRNGWYHTGDIGKIDEHGYVYILDREKDMIISGGENIYPREVEMVLERHPGVAYCAVIGVPDEQWGESVKALIVKKPGQEVDANTLLHLCQTHLAGYKKPRSIEFRGNLPMSAVGKILKHEIREEYWVGRSRKI